MIPPVTRSEIAAGLLTLGLKAGDTAFVHSSLSSFGHVEGGAETVVRAFLDVLGPDGTLSVPIFRKGYFTEDPDQVWDRDNSPSQMGRISETVRTWPGACRSPHAVHPIAAVGRLAEDLADRHHATDFNFGSPFSRLLEVDAWVVLLGVPYNNITLIHLLEERAEIPYRHWVIRSGTVIDGGISRRAAFPFLQRHPGVGNDFLPLGARMEEADQVRSATIGNCAVRAFRARDLYDTGLSALRRDPLFLVREKDREEARRYLPRYGEALDTAPKHPLHQPTPPVARRLAEVLRIPRPFVPFNLTTESTEITEERHRRQERRESTHLHFRIKSIEPPPSTVQKGEEGGYGLSSAPGEGEAGLLDVQIRNRWETPDHLVIEELRITGGPNPLVPGAIAIPKNRKGPLPAVICLHGTGGTWEREMESGFSPRGSTLIGWARELARRGFVALAITQFSHPPRPEPWDWEGPKILPVYGRTGMGQLVADVLLSVDYLRGRPEVDPGRIGVGGFSLGGIAAFYGFAVDQRIAACFTFCGGVGSVHRLIREGSIRYHSVYYYPDGLLSGHLDHPRIVPALVPRPLLVCGATQDVGMPLSGLREFESAASAVYMASGAGDRFSLFVDEGPHAMTMPAFEAASKWLGKHL